MTKAEIQKEEIKEILGKKFKDITWRNFHILPKQTKVKIKAYFSDTYGLSLTSAARISRLLS